MGVPTFAFVNGVALGGGLELALNCDYRTSRPTCARSRCPRPVLGLVPGWGGAYIVPRLVGIEKALDVILTRPAAEQAVTPRPRPRRIGLTDVVLDPADFLEESIRWAARVLAGEVVVARREPDRAEPWDGPSRRPASASTRASTGRAPRPTARSTWSRPPATASRDEAFAAEDEALADLIMSDEMRASLYAFGLVSGRQEARRRPGPRRSRSPSRGSASSAPGSWRAQIAMLFAQRLGVPVVMRDLDQERVDKGLGRRAAVASSRRRAG